MNGMVEAMGKRDRSLGPAQGGDQSLSDGGAPEFHALSGFGMIREQVAAEDPDEADADQ